MRSVIRMGLTIGCLAFAGGASAVGVDEEKEYREWKALLAQTSAKGPVPETLKLLGGFLQAHPKGEHAPDVRFATGEILFEDGQYAQALGHYQALVDQKDAGYLGDALLRLGEVYYNTKRFPQARRSWEKLTDSTPGGSLLAAEALYGLALCDLRDKNYLAADKKLERLIRKFPAYANQSKTRELLGSIRFQQKDYAEARSHLEGVTTPLGAFYRGLSFFYQKQYLEAAKSFSDLTAMETGTYAEIGLYFKAECFRMAQNAPLAIQAYDEFIQSYPGSRLKLYALIQKASFLSKENRDAEAEAGLKLVKALTPPKDVLAYALYMESQLAAKKGDNKAAVNLIDQALALLPPQMNDLSLNIHLAKVFYLLQRERWAEAGTLLQKCLQKVAYNPIGIVAYMLLGQDAYLRKDWNSAATSYESALLKHPYNSLSDIAMAMLLSTAFQAQKYQELVTNANRVVQVMDAQFSVQNRLWRAYSHFLIAESYYRLRMYPEASRYYEEAVKHPAMADQARLYLAWSRYHESKYADAIALAQQVFGQGGVAEPYRASAYFLMAGSYFNQKNYTAAIEAFRGFRKKFPQDSHAAESWLQEGWAHRLSGYPGDAVTAWHKLASLFPDDALAQDASLQVGQLYFAAREYPKAAGAFVAFLARWPRSVLAVEAQWSLAQSYYNAGLFDKAIKEYELFQDKFSADQRLADARNQVMLARYRQASRSNDPRLLAEFVRLYPKSTQAPEAQYQVSRVYFEKKDWASATEQFRKLLLDYPGTGQAPSALFAVAQAQEQLKKIRDAVSEYESLLRLFPTDPLALDAAMRLGAIYFNQGKFAEAARSFGFVVQREAPSEVKADAIYNAGICFKKESSHDEALKNFGLFTASFAQDPRHTDVLLQMASIHMAAGRPLKGIETYGKLLDRTDVSDAQKIEIHAQIGDTYKSMEDKGKAVESYSKLLALSPLNADARLLGLVQLAAIYEERESWENALEVYEHIRKSQGKAEWVKAAARRRKEIKAYLAAQKKNLEVVQVSSTTAGAYPNGSAQ